MSLKHKQAKVNFFGEIIEVDEGLAKLLQLIWANEIETLLSCQENHPGIAWIQFPDAGSFQEFMNLVAVYPAENENHWETLYGRMTQLDLGCWEYHMIPVNRGVKETIVNDEVIQTFLGYHDFETEISVRFPVTDIPFLESILEIPFLESILEQEYND